MNAKHTPGPKPLSRLMQQAIDKIGDDWGPYPTGIYCRTLDAMEKRGLIECRFNQEDKTSRYQYRKAPAIAKAAGAAS